MCVKYVERGAIYAVEKNGGRIAEKIVGCVEREQGSSAPDQVYFCGDIWKGHKDQDRLIISPDMSSEIFFCAVCDGHCSQGGSIAERAALELRASFQKELAKCSNLAGVDSAEFRNQMQACFERIFHTFHLSLENEYNEKIRHPLEKMRKKMEKDAGVPLPLHLPMVGGTTATVAIMVGDLLSIGWVGDSRAILCSVDSDGIHAAELTRDHNVASNSAERKRAEDAGGAICGHHVAVDEAEGMLQVLRSLGDIPHHRNDILSDIPELIFTELDSKKHAFVVVASDGLWEHCTPQHVASCIMDHVVAAKRRQVGSSIAVADVFLDACSALKGEINRLVTQQKSRRDDVSVCVFTVPGFDFQRYATEQLCQ